MWRKRHREAPDYEEAPSDPIIYQQRLLIQRIYACLNANEVNLSLTRDYRLDPRLRSDLESIARATFADSYVPALYCGDRYDGASQIPSERLIWAKQALTEALRNALLKNGLPFGYSSHCANQALIDIARDTFPF
jgi:hypothetical protein